MGLKNLPRMVTVNKMKFDFVPQGGTSDAAFILRRLQEEYYANGKSLYVFC